MKKEIEKKEETALAVLDIKKFDKLKIEITELVEKVKTTVKSSTAETPYELLKEKKKTLQKKRVETTKMLKAERAVAVAFQKKILEVEGEILKIINPVEDGLDTEIKVIDDEKERKSRLVTLPERKEKLAAIGVIIDDDIILMMDGIKFSAFFNEKNTEFLAQKERELNEEKIKLEQEKEEAENKRQREIELEEAREQAAEREKKAQERKIEEEAWEKKKEEERLEKEKEEADLKMVRDEKFKEFLVKNGYKSDGSFKIERDGASVTLYKKIGEITL